MMGNPGKFQYMLFGKHSTLKVEIEGFHLELAKSVNALGIAIDHNLKFDTLYQIFARRLVKKLKG